MAPLLNTRWEPDQALGNTRTPAIARARAHASTHAHTHAHTHTRTHTHTHTHTHHHHHHHHHHHLKQTANKPLLTMLIFRGCQIFYSVDFHAVFSFSAMTICKTHVVARTQTHIHTHARTHTRARTHAHTHTHTHTRTHARTRKKREKTEKTTVLAQTAHRNYAYSVKRVEGQRPAVAVSRCCLRCLIVPVTAARCFASLPASLSGAAIGTSLWRWSVER